VTRLDDVPLRRDGLVVHELAGECVLFVPDTGDLHQLNPPATVVWKLLGPGVSLRRIAFEIAEAAETDLDRVENDVLALAERLGELGLLRLPSGASEGSGSA
jgi:hypothetical protein